MDREKAGRDEFGMWPSSVRHSDRFEAKGQISQQNKINLKNGEKIRSDEKNKASES